MAWLLQVNLLRILRPRTTATRGSGIALLKQLSYWMISVGIHQRNWLQLKLEHCPLMLRFFIFHGILTPEKRFSRYFKCQNYVSLNSHRNLDYSPPVISSNKGWTKRIKKVLSKTSGGSSLLHMTIYNNLVYISWVAFVIKQFLVVNPAHETLISPRFIFRLRWDSHRYAMVMALRCVIFFDVYYMYTYDAHNDYCISWVPPCCTMSGFCWTNTRRTKQMPVVHGYT